MWYNVERSEEEEWKKSDNNEPSTHLCGQVREKVYCVHCIHVHNMRRRFQWQYFKIAINTFPKWWCSTVFNLNFYMQVMLKFGWIDFCLHFVEFNLIPRIFYHRRGCNTLHFEFEWFFLYLFDHRFQREIVWVKRDTIIFFN